MHVTVSGAVRWRSAVGFSLLEVVVAAGLLLMTIAAVTACITGVSRGEARLQTAMDADRAVCAVAERLRGLHFCAATYPDSAAVRGLGAGDLVAAVFPHARVSQNTETARYAAAEEEDVPAGSFVTLLEEGGVDVRCVARFLVSEGGAALSAGDLDGWSTSTGIASPGAAVEVRLTAVGSGATRGVLLTRSALATPSIGQQSSSVLGAPA